MRNIRQIYFCASINFRKWFTQPKYFIIVILALQVNMLSMLGYTFYCLQAGAKITPWVLAFMTSGVPALYAYGLLCVLLFCDAPFQDAHTPFVIIRTGKRNWILGQLLYIAMASLIFVLFYYCLALLPLLPVLTFSSEWGEVIFNSVLNSSEMVQYNLPWMPKVSLDAWVLQNFTAIQASLLSLLLLWLSTTLAGMIIFAGNLLLRPGVGTTICSALVITSGFSFGFGLGFYGKLIYYFSPFLWGALPMYSSPDMLPFTYTIPAMIFAIIVLASAATVVFCEKDIDIQKGAKK